MFDSCFPQDPELASGASCEVEGLDAVIDCHFAKATCVVNEIVFHSVPVTVGSPPEVFDIPLVLVWIALCAVFFTLYLGFINFRFFGYAWQLLCGKYNEPGAKGELSNFQSLATSMAGTVGLGNIAGVAVAVSLGGPGAVFWMMVMGFLGMSSKFAEVMLGVKYRRKLDGEGPHKFVGGPMYYVRDAFEQRGIKYIGGFLAVFFAVCCMLGSIGAGNMFQANQALEQVVRVSGGEEASFFADKGWLFGVVLAALVGAVIIGGLKSIGRVSSSLVPAMAVIYLSACFYVIALHYEDIPSALITIFTEAFTPEAGIAGVIGGMLVGIQRAAFSNEAGLGSAAIVQATARTDYPVRQGFVGMLGPFIDTVIVCMATALLIVVTGMHETGQGLAGVELTSQALEQGGEWLAYVLAVAVFLFAFSTQITWYYYGEVGATYIFGEKKWVALSFKIIFLVFTVIGCASQLENVIAFADALFLSMAFANIVALYILAPEIKRDLKAYILQMKSQ